MSRRINRVSLGKLAVSVGCISVLYFILLTTSIDVKRPATEHNRPHHAIRQAGYLKTLSSLHESTMPSMHKQKTSEETLEKTSGKTITTPIPTIRPIQYWDFIRFLDMDKSSDNLINTQNFNFAIDSYVCQKTSPFALILVHSAVTNQEQRQMIRTTWGSVKSSCSLAMATVFLVGLGTSGDRQIALEAEAAQYGDLVQGPFLDTYRNLTYKHVMGLVWAWRHCPQAMYVVKVDDDTLVNPYLLLTFLKDVGVQDRVIYCGQFSAGSPHRNKTKWQVTVEEYPLSRYPSYCEGFAYVLRMQTGKRLADAARTSKFFWIDDLYVTGFLRTKAGVQLRNFNAPFHFARLSEEVLEDCRCPKMVIFFRGETGLSETYLQVWKHISNSFALAENQKLMFNASKNR